MKRSKKFLSVLAALAVGVVTLFSFAGCGNRLEDYENPESYTDEEILEMFDLEEKSSVWTDLNQEFAFDIVIITFKKTRVFPELKLENLHLSKAESLEYVFLKPYDMSDRDYVERFRQMAFIHLKERTREAVVTTIRELEALPFISYAGPDYIDSGD